MGCLFIGQQETRISGPRPAAKSPPPHLSPSPSLLGLRSAGESSGNAALLQGGPLPDAF